MKFYTKAHGFKVSFLFFSLFQKLKIFFQKPNHLVINLEDDENLILKETDTLKEKGIENEDEISFFNMREYLEFKKNPEQLKWE